MALPEKGAGPARFLTVKETVPAAGGQRRAAGGEDGGVCHRATVGYPCAEAMRDVIQMKPLLMLLGLLFVAGATAQTFNGRTASEWVKDLGAEDQTTRDYAVWALTTMQDRAVRASLRALDDERPVVRQHAALVLGRLGATAAEARERLQAKEHDPDAQVRKAATVAAVRVQVAAAEIPRLIELLRTPDWDLRLAAAEVLRELGAAAKPAANALVELLESEDATLDRTVVLRIPRARTQHWNVREAAAQALAAIGPVDGVPVVEGLRLTLKNREWAAREGAVTALAAFPSDAATVDAVCDVLAGDDTWSCRRAAAEALPKLVPAGSPLLPAVVPRAIAALGDDDGGVRRLAADFLGGCGAAAAAAVPEFVAMLGSQDQKQREYAVKALRRLGPVAKAAKNEMIAYYHALPDDREWLQREALEALAAVAPEARKELPALETMLAERERPVLPAAVQRQQAIAEALGRIQDADLDQRLRALGPIVELRGVEAIPHLLPWLAPDRELRERIAATHVLALLDAEVALPKLRTLLAAKEPELQTAAAHALALFADAESQPQVAAVLAKGIATASKDELWFMGMTHVVELAPFLERIVADSAEVPLRRWGATQALGYLEAPTSAEVVAAMLSEAGKADGKDSKLPERERQQLLAVGLRVLADLDAEGHRALFVEHAKADENEVRDAALYGLARLGDAEAQAALQQSAGRIEEPDVPEALRARLEATRLRLNQVRYSTLRDVLARLEKALGLPIVVSKQAPPGVLDARFSGMYIELIGFRPSALTILGVLNSDFMVQGASLVPRFHADRIELLTADEAKTASGK